MKRLLAILIIAGAAIGHVPVITPSDKPTGDAPPKLEERPLPPIVFICPELRIPIIMVSTKFII